MHRVFVDTIDEKRATAGAEEAHHMKRVLRLKPGDPVEMLDGRGGLWSGAIGELDEKSARMEVTDTLPNREPRLRVTLYQGVARGERMDYTVQKCTEIGVYAIICVEMTRSVASLKGAESKLKRLERIAREAAKQCGRSRVPLVEAYTFAEALERMKAEPLLLMPWEEGGATLNAAAEGMGDMAGLIIGPEGGIDAKEARVFMCVGARPVTLGPRILRTETAGPVTLALLLHMSGDMA